MFALRRTFAGFGRFLSFPWVRPLGTLRALRRRRRHDRDPRASERDRHRSPYPCVPINRPELRRPDPLIYSQYFLMGQGLAVTWDNPDIVLMKDGAVVASSALRESTEYEIVARIWNASTTCPVISLPVYVSYLDFGVGTKSVAIGKTHVDLGVKGGPGCPAFAKVPWRTPATPGHYCIQVLLAPPDDVNFANNLGQENATVGVAASPATFEFQLRNATDLDQTYRFRADTYQIPRPGPCDAAGPPRSGGPGLVDFKAQAFGPRPAVNRTRVDRHAPAHHPLPPGWQVELSPAVPTLRPDEQITVRATVHPPDDFQGTQVVNVNAFFATGHAAGLVGGVSLTVVRE